MATLSTVVKKILFFFHIQDVPIGTRVTTVNATRSESSDPVYYSLLSGGDAKFQVNSTSGTIITTGAVDREKRSSYTVTQ